MAQCLPRCKISWGMCFCTCRSTIRANCHAATLLSATRSPCQRISRPHTKRHLTGSRTQDPELSDMAVLRAVLVIAGDEGVKRGGRTGPSTVLEGAFAKRSHTRSYSSHNCDTYRRPLHGVGDAPGDVGKRAWSSIQCKSSQAWETSNTKLHTVFLAPLPLQH